MLPLKRVTSCFVFCLVFSCICQSFPAGDGADKTSWREACEKGPQGRADHHSGDSAACPKWTSSTHRPQQGEENVRTVRLHRRWEIEDINDSHLKVHVSHMLVCICHFIFTAVSKCWTVLHRDNSYREAQRNHLWADLQRQQPTGIHSACAF